MTHRTGTYVSIDIETDGPIPGPHSMLSLGAAAFRLTSPDTYELVDTFTVNLAPLDGAAPDPDTEAWWAKQDPAVYAAARDGAIDPADAMRRFVTWTGTLPGRRPALVAYPILFDGMFVHWYLHRFTGGSPYSHSGEDIKTLAAHLTRRDYRDVSKRDIASRWPVPGKHTHVALDDAIEQGEQFMKMLVDPASRVAPMADTPTR